MFLRYSTAHRYLSIKGLQYKKYPLEDIISYAEYPPGLQAKMKRFWSLYATVMRRHPAKTQLLTTGTLAALGDLVAQKLIERKESVDVQRTARFFTVGLCLVGPAYGAW